MFPVAAKPAPSAAKLEQRSHIIRVDELDASHLKVAWNVGEIELKTLLSRKQVRVQDRLIDVAFRERIERASGNRQGFRLSHCERWIKIVVNDDVELSRRPTRCIEPACRHELERHGKHFQSSTAIDMHLLENSVLGPLTQ